MCDPFTIAGIALTAGSMGANMMAQSQVADARNDALNAERIRQQGYDKQADALNTQSQDRYKDFEGQQQQKAQDLSKYFQSNQTPAEADPNNLPPINTSSNTVVANEQAKQTAKAKAFSNQQAGALGTLRSFGDLLGGIGRSQARDAQGIAQVGNFKQGSSNVLGLELDQANQAGGGLKLFGDLLGGLGSLGTSYGLGRNVAGTGAKTLAGALGAASPYGGVITSAPTMAASRYGPQLPLTGSALQTFNLY